MGRATRLPRRVAGASRGHDRAPGAPVGVRAPTGEEIGLFLSLRNDAKWHDEEFTAAVRFCRALTGQSEHAAKFARGELEAYRVIVPTGKAGRAKKYRLGSADEVAEAERKILRAHETATVDAVAHAFDAEETIVERTR